MLDKESRGCPHPESVYYYIHNQAGQQQPEDQFGLEALDKWDRILYQEKHPQRHKTEQTSSRN